MSLEDFEKLQQMVWYDLSLQEELGEITDRERFVSRLIEIGTERGLQFGNDEVTQAMRESRRVWIERWI